MYIKYLVHAWHLVRYFSTNINSLPSVQELVLAILMSELLSLESKPVFVSLCWLFKVRTFGEKSCVPSLCYIEEIVIHVNHIARCRVRTRMQIVTCVFLFCPSPKNSLKVA